MAIDNGVVHRGLVRAMGLMGWENSPCNQGNLIACKGQDESSKAHPEAICFRLFRRPTSAIEQIYSMCSGRATSVAIHYNVSKLRAANTHRASGHIARCMLPTGICRTGTSHATYSQGIASSRQECFAKHEYACQSNVR